MMLLQLGADAEKTLLSLCNTQLHQNLVWAQGDASKEYLSCIHKKTQGSSKTERFAQDEMVAKPNKAVIKTKQLS